MDGEPPQQIPSRSVSSPAHVRAGPVATVKRWLEQLANTRVLWFLLLGTLFVDGLGAVVLAGLEFYMAATLIGTMAAGTMLAIGITNWWALYSTLRRREHSWPREVVIAQVLVLLLTGYIVLTDWRSPEISWPVMAIAVLIFIVGLLWILFLGASAGVEWTKTSIVITALLPLVGLLQFWLQTYYIPQTLKPLVDISSDLSLQSQTGPTMHLSAKVTVHNRGTGG